MLLLWTLQELILLQTGVKLKPKRQIGLLPPQLLLQQPANWFFLLRSLPHGNASNLQTS